MSLIKCQAEILKLHLKKQAFKLIGKERRINLRKTKKRDFIESIIIGQNYTDDRTLVALLVTYILIRLRHLYEKFGYEELYWILRAGTETEGKYGAKHETK